MGRIKRILTIAVFGFAAAGFLAAAPAVHAEENAVIPSEVYVGEVAVGGMTAEEAQAAVAQYVDGMMDAQITLTTGEKQTVATAENLGVKWVNTGVVEEAVEIGKAGNLIERYKAIKDLEHEPKVYEIEYEADHSVTSSWLEANASVLNQNAVDNGLTRQDGQFVFIEGQEGIELDVEASTELVEKYFKESWQGGDASLELAAKVVEPGGSREELEQIQDVLGAFSTDFSDSSAGRVANVKNATSKIDGTLLFPGEEFSVYDAIGPLDASNGYELAGAYENGTTVESYGGGVCQVSTTLYNAVIRAELEVTERFAHSMMVSYVEPSMDAAIAGTYKNLRFVNSWDTPIYIEGYTNGGMLYFNIFGHETRPAGRVVSFVSETTSQEDPVVKFVATADPIGVVRQTQSPHIGKTAKLWKIVTVDGVEESREAINSSKYNASPRIFSVGTASLNPESVNAINEAIATQDEATITATAAYWSDAAVADRAAQAAAAQQAAEQEASQPEEPAQDDSGKKNNKKNDSGKKNDSDSKKDSEE